MAKATAAQAKAAKTKRNSIMKDRKGLVDKMKAARKAGNKDAAKKYREQVLGKSKLVKDQDQIRLSAMDKGGLKTHAKAVGSHWDKKVADMKDRLAKVKTKGNAGAIASHQKAVTLLEDRLKKNKDRVKKWL